jgi:hypothetical protein
VTFRLHFREELDFAAMKANQAVAINTPRRRRKSAPVRALLAINALWPDGVPSEIILLNCTLCNEINAWLKKRSLPEVKDDTILRAAKRRR